MFNGFTDFLLLKLLVSTFQSLYFCFQSSRFLHRYFTSTQVRNLGTFTISGYSFCDVIVFFLFFCRKATLEKADSVVVVVEGTLAVVSVCSCAV